MENEIRVRTPYTLAMLQRYQRFFCLRCWTDPGRRIWLISAYFGALTGFLVGIFSDWSLAPWVYVLVGLAVLSLLLLLQAGIAPKSQYRKQARYLRRPKEFIFTPETFTVIIEPENGRPDSVFLRLHYASLYTVYETKTDFFLMSTPYKGYLVAKDLLAPGQADCLRGWMERQAAYHGGARKGGRQ